MTVKMRRLLYHPVHLRHIEIHQPIQHILLRTLLSFQTRRSQPLDVSIHEQQ
jgi:hypothetical protein